jgi:hypothetical protein
MLIGRVAQGAQGGDTVRTHVDHVVTSFPGAPQKQGLLPAAFAELRIAVEHARLALGTPDDIKSIRMHAGHVLHALDPSVEAQGPGLGFGLKQAAAGVAQHIELAAKAEGAPAAVKTHATHVAAAANHVVSRLAGIIDLIQQARKTESAGQAVSFMAMVAVYLGQLEIGVDMNGDRQIEWSAPEGGLSQAQQHMDLLKGGLT